MKRFLRYYLFASALLALLYLGTGAKLRASGANHMSRDQLQNRVQLLRKELKDVMVAIDNLERDAVGKDVAVDQSMRESGASGEQRASDVKRYNVTLVNKIEGLDPNLHAVRLVRSNAAQGKRGPTRTEYANISRVTHRGPGENKFDSFSGSVKRMTLEMVKRDDRNQKFSKDSEAIGSCYHKGLDVQQIDPSQVGANILVQIDGSVHNPRCTVSAK